MKYLVERRLRGGAGLRHNRPRHRSYWQRMAQDRVLLYGGAWAEGQGDTLIVQVTDPAALRHVLGGDPYAQESLVVDIRTRQLGDAPDWEGAGPVPGTEPSAHVPATRAAHGVESAPGAGRAAAPGTALGAGRDSAPGSGLGTVSALWDRTAAPSVGQEPLSAHESRITRMMMGGMTNRQMAACLGVSSRAVEQHITRIYRKLAISRRAQLAVALHGRPAA